MSSASAGIGSRPRRSSSHSVSRDGSCSRMLAVSGLGTAAAAAAAAMGDSRSETGDVLSGGDGSPPTDVSMTGRRSSRLSSSCLDSGSSACTSWFGYSRFRMDRHSSSDCESASSVLRDGITRCRCLS